MFETLTPAPPDPILGLAEAYRADPRADKVNLGVGVYQEEDGRTPVLGSVKAAEAALLASESTKNYLPITGSPEFVRAVIGWAGFSDHPAVRGAQVPGGTGGVRVAADFLAECLRERRAWLSDPSWPNHRGIFAAAGFETATYPWYEPRTGALAWDRITDALEQVPAGHAVVLHLSCHNPTGADPSPTQWSTLANLAERRGWIPVIDAAYVGFGGEVADDVRPLVEFARRGLEFFVSISFSKNFGLYRERVGCLLWVGRDECAAEVMSSRIKRIIRVLYSNPPAHGAEIVRTILEDELLKDLWRRELQAMRERMVRMRQALAAELSARLPDRDWSFLVRQRGMFSLLGLDRSETEWLRQERAIYMTGDSRINVAGLTLQNVGRVGQAIAEVIRRRRPA